MAAEINSLSSYIKLTRDIILGNSAQLEYQEEVRGCGLKTLAEFLKMCSFVLSHQVYTSYIILFIFKEFQYCSADNYIAM